MARRVYVAVMPTWALSRASDAIFDAIFDADFDANFDADIDAESDAGSDAPASLQPLAGPRPHNRINTTMLNNAFASLRTIVGLAVLAATVSAGSASAAVVAYTDHDAFLAAFSDVHTDRFDSLPAGLNAGPYAGAGYAASAFDPIGYPADQHADALFGVDNGAGGHWLSSNFATSLLQFAFGPNIAAVGGWFFGTDVDGALVPGALTLTVRDASGSFDFLFDPALAGGFLGFASDSAIESLSVAARQASSPSYATLGQLEVGVVPEPGALSLLGVAALALLASRRKLN